MNCIHPPSLTLPRCRYLGSAWLSRAISWCYRSVATESARRKNKKSDFYATFLRLGTLFRPWNVQTSCCMAGYLRFLRLEPRSGDSKQSLIAKKLQIRPLFCFWVPEVAARKLRGRGGGALTLRPTRFAGESCSNHLFDLNGVQSCHLSHCIWA